MHKLRTVFFLITGFLFFQPVSAQVTAFPGAEGGGKFTTGGRGGRVLFVDNLNDKGNGSLRKAVETDGPRTIVFRVSGNIILSKPLYIKKGDLTIAGQTAPGDGICLQDYGLIVEAGNVIIRYIRVRPGDLKMEENDAASGHKQKNIIIDHCSFSWAIDEVASFYDNENFTMQWCIVSESLYKSAHHKGEHGYGGIWGGLNATFHHNLVSDHTSRNPRLCGSRYSDDPAREKVDIRNNVIYNWGFNSIYGGEEGNYNLVANYFKPGPATRNREHERILDLTQSFYDTSINPDSMHAGWFYIDGNVMEGSPDVTNNNWGNGIQGKGVDEAAKERSRLNNPVQVTELLTDDAEVAYQKVLENAGCNLVSDIIDRRVIKEARTGREKLGKSFEGGGNGIIDSQTDAGNWPVLKSKRPLPDSDNDGIPDKWEKSQKLNPADPADAILFSLDKNYTNIEVYINSLVKQK